MSLLCKKDTLAKSEEVKTAWSDLRQIWQKLLRKAVTKKKGCFADDDDDEIHALKMYGKWNYTSIILNLGTRWRWVVSFTPLSLYPKKRPPVPIV
jgi:hypothetical protein